MMAAVAAIAMLAFCSLASAAKVAVLPECAAKLGVKSWNEMQVIMVADPGDFTGSAEAKWFIAHLTKENLITDFFPSCAHVYTGVILQQKVAVVTTGINAVTAALCTNELMACNRYFENIVYAGTSGWSAGIGGVLNADPDTNACAETSNKLTDASVTRIGDICVSPVSINWDCRQTSWSEQCRGFPDVCSYPAADAGPDASYLYGNCYFSDAPSYNLAYSDKFIAAAATTQFSTNQPLEGDVIYPYNNLYWNLTANGTGNTYYQAPESQIPTVYNYTQCAEVDSQFFFSGVPWDMEAREFVASLISTSGIKNVTMEEVIAVSAMEAIGFMQVMQRINTDCKFPDCVKYSNVRANSDWLHLPVMKLGDGTWGYGNFTFDFNNGYAYAIVTFSNVILTKMQLTCLETFPADMCVVNLSTYSKK